jgi:hypothetical protein
MRPPVPPMHAQHRGRVAAGAGAVEALIASMMRKTRQIVISVTDWPSPHGEPHEGARVGGEVEFVWL